MNTVDFFTFVCPKDIKKLAQPGELEARIQSHDYPFNNVNVIRQRCGHDFDDVVFPLATEWRSEDFPDILHEYNLPDVDEKAELHTIGPTAPHYWKHHVINHLIGLKVSRADYVVFSDCDCRIDSQPSSWVNVAIDTLKKYNDVLIVSPYYGVPFIEEMRGDICLTMLISQQLFCCERERFENIDFNVPWDYEFECVSRPHPVYYYMLEGRMWRYMQKHGLYRARLPETWRYRNDEW